MDRLQRSWAWVRSSPLHMATVAGVFVAAIAAGVAFGVVISGDDQATGSAPTSSPNASPLESAIESASPSASPSPLASASASANPTPQETPVESGVESSTPAPTPSPEGGYGGATGDLFDITGEWDRLAPMPGGYEFRTSDSIVLPDGRLAVFRWNSGSEDSTTGQVLVYDRERDTWEPVTFAGERLRISTELSVVLGADERLYAFYAILDMSGDAWVVEPFKLVQESDEWQGSSLAVGGDGKIYRRAQDTASSRTELIAYDPETETFERSSKIGGLFDLAYTGPDGDIVLLGYGQGHASMVTYDPDTDEWSDLTAISDAIAPERAEVGPDGNVYVNGYDYDVPQLWAIGIDDGVMRSVELPDGVTEWEPNLLSTPDNHLFAFGRGGDAWEFSPDE